MNWHYVDQGQQAGPVTEEQLLKLSQEGKVHADTLVWRDGLPNWIPFRESGLPISPSQIQPPTLASENIPAPDGAVCAECGKIFPVEETIRYGNARVCAACKPVFLQKLAEGARVNTGEFNYAGFWIRFGAKMLDGLILGVPFMIIFFVILMPSISESAQNNRYQAAQSFQVLPTLLQLVFIFVRLGYETFFMGKYGATPGKMVCKLKVVTADGERLSYGRALGRALAEILSGMICYIGYLIVPFDSQKRALHDHICNTRVVQK